MGKLSSSLGGSDLYFILGETTFSRCTVCVGLCSMLKSHKISVKFCHLHKIGPCRTPLKNSRQLHEH